MFQAIGGGVVRSLFAVRTRIRFGVMVAPWWFVPLAGGHTEPVGLVWSGNYENEAFDSLTFVNSVVGWDLFYNANFRGGSTVIANVEAGQIWTGHEAFVRAPGAVNGITALANPAPGALNELDFHATMVGHVLAGTGYVPTDGGSYTYLGLGMAPEAALVSGAVATGFSDTEIGSFTTTGESVVGMYRAFFQGLGTGRADVINSSWGGGDPAATEVESLALDGLARQNPTVALVVAAGNGGNAAVGAPASGYNNIAVGAVGGASFLAPSDFSSQGAADFYNPVTHVTLTGVRAAVDLAAPGERMVLAAYLGDSGSLGAAAPTLVQQPSPADLYFLNSDGTSFSAPMVAGGISLLKDAANTLLAGVPDAKDTRVIKSVLMAGATPTVGWTNGQNAMNVTTQALDLRTGAGSMNLETSADIYYFGTTGLVGAGGAIADQGWDTATVNLGTSTDYVFADAFTGEMALTVALNWFAVREFDNTGGTGADVAFANLDLQVWAVDGDGQFSTKVGESISTYNNTELLRFAALAPGRYGFRVRFDELVFDTTGTAEDEFFALAWQALPVPEPAWQLLACGGLLVALRRRRTCAASEESV